MPDVPIIANGNIRSWDDVVNNKKFTQSAGVMSAEGLLNDPTLFSGAVKGGPLKKDPLEIALEYVEIAEIHPVPIKSVIFHIRRMIASDLEKYQFMVDLLESESLSDVKRVIQKTAEVRDTCLRTGVEFVPDPKVATLHVLIILYAFNVCMFTESGKSSGSSCTS